MEKSHFQWTNFWGAGHGMFHEVHQVFAKPEYRVQEKVSQCYVDEKKCASIDEFNSFSKKYMSN